MGEFLSHTGIIWRAEILQEAEALFTEIGNLVFEADEPLVIEWDNTGKEEVICASTATLRVESPGDRTYENLYTIEPGCIRLDVYRNNVLYWSGMLDPEFYEEPYERAAHYPVSLTFSDFGILDRKKYALADMHTLEELVVYCLNESGLNFGGLDEKHISTSMTASGEAVRLSDLKVRSDNFYDEDGEAITLREVLEGIFQPLGLRIVQRAGIIYVYDLNGLYTKSAARPVIWEGDRSTMGVDVVYNNAKITWSTYAQSGNIAPQECWEIETDSNLMCLNNLSGASRGDARYYSFHYSTDLKDWIDATDCGFTLWLSRTGKNATLLTDTVNFFKIVPQYDGSESEGIALFFNAVQGIRIGNGNNWSAQYSWQGKGTNPGYLAGTAASIDFGLFRSANVWLPPVGDTKKLLLRITVNMLMDPRFNPFESAVNIMKYVEQKDWQDQWKSRGNYVYVPVTIKFKPDGSDKVYCWSNRHIVTQDIKAPVRNLAATYGRWEEYDTTKDDKPNVWGYLCYYDSSDRADASGVANGWKKNRPGINPHTQQIISILQNAEDGQYIPYPDYGVGGTLWMEVRADGWLISDNNTNLSTTEIMNPHNLWGENGGMRGPKMSWILMQLPEIEIMNNVQFDQTIDTEDVEYKAEINAGAKETIEIETICGSSANGVPTARGAYFDSSTGKQITQLSRAGRTAQIEDLLIGTLYSQFAERHTKLSGEIKLSADGITTYEEQNQKGKKFMITTEVQDVITDNSETVIVELRPDEYTKIKD